MDQDVRPDLESFGLAAARELAGPEAVERVEVVEGVDAWDRPAWHFIYLIDRDRSMMDVGLLLIRLGQKLKDELSERGDENRPWVRLLDRADWEKRAWPSRLS